jgi:AcrR family transcriptional regulator
MRGRLPARPLADIAEAAVRVFTAKGFRTAVISDVAKALGLSHGAVYTYVESKHALLYLALMHRLDPAAVQGLEAPVTTPQPDEIVDLVRTWAAREQILSELSDTLIRPTHTTENAVRLEIETIVDRLYDFIERHRTTLQLVERCSAELPELAQWYFVETRRGMLARLGEFLTARIEAGMLRPVPDVPVAARFIVETIAWFAMHRHGDPDSAMLTDDDCRRTVRHLVPAAFLRAD